MVGKKTRKERSGGQSLKKNSLVHDSLVSLSENQGSG